MDDWQNRIERFVEARSTAARTVADPDMAAMNRAWSEGAWYVLELCRQMGTPTAGAVRLAGARRLGRWRLSADAYDRARYESADWALWELEHRPRPATPSARTRGTSGSEEIAAAR